MCQYLILPCHCSVKRDLINIDEKTKMVLFKFSRDQKYSLSYLRTKIAHGLKCRD
jgi:hypothetical protein